MRGRQAPTARSPRGQWLRERASAHAQVPSATVRLRATLALLVARRFLSFTALFSAERASRSAVCVVQTNVERVAHDRLVAGVWVWGQQVRLLGPRPLCVPWLRKGRMAARARARTRATHQVGLGRGSGQDGRQRKGRGQAQDLGRWAISAGCFVVWAAAGHEVAGRTPLSRLQARCPRRAAATVQGKAHAEGCLNPGRKWLGSKYCSGPDQDYSVAGRFARLAIFAAHLHLGPGRRAHRHGLAAGRSRARDGAGAA